LVSGTSINKDESSGDLERGWAKELALSLAAFGDPVATIM